MYNINLIYICGSLLYFLAKIDLPLAQSGIETPLSNKSFIDTAAIDFKFIIRNYTYTIYLLL